MAGETGYLILISHHAAGLREEFAEISRPQAGALLELTTGQTEYLSIPIDIGSYSAAVQRFVTPAPLDLISITFKQDKTAHKFQPPACFGLKVTSEPSYQGRILALAGLPSASEVEVTNEALHSLLDVLQHRTGEPQLHPIEMSRVSETLETTLDPQAEQELDRLNIEDSVIRELPRSLQPQGAIAARVMASL